MTDQPISNPAMQAGMEAMHELRQRIRRDLRKQDLPYIEGYLTGCLGALSGFMMGALGPENALALQARVLQELETGFKADKELVN